MDNTFQQLRERKVLEEQTKRDLIVPSFVKADTTKRKIPQVNIPGWKHVSGEFWYKHEKTGCAVFMEPPPPVIWELDKKLSSLPMNWKLIKNYTKQTEKEPDFFYWNSKTNKLTWIFPSSNDEENNDEKMPTFLTTNDEIVNDNKTTKEEELVNITQTKEKVIYEENPEKEYLQPNKNVETIKVPSIFEDD